MPVTVRLALATIILVTICAACGGGSASLPGSAPTATPSPGPSTNGPANTTITIAIPLQGSGESLGRRPAYVSAATESFNLSLTNATGIIVLNQTFNVGVGATGCEMQSQQRVCTFSIEPLAGSYVAAITTFSGSSGSGAVLSEDQSVAVTIKAGITNTLAFALYGVPATLQVTPTGSLVAGSQAKGFIASGPMPSETFTVSAVDASGNVIVGAGAPTFSVSASNASFSVEAPTQADPNQFTLTPPASFQAIASDVTVTATGGNAAACAAPDAQCKATFTLSYAPFADDDWITFAHDFARTGRETQATGIDGSSVTQLTQRWKVQLPSGEPVYAAMAVYDGNIIINGWWGNVYDLSAQDGHIIWERNIGGYPNMGPPAIDTADGIVFVGTRVTNATTRQPEPSPFYALKLSDGSVIWQATMSGVIRAAPVYADGTVYEGDSGGDPPYCINGGISAYNALTGGLEWRWLVNPVVTTGGGGAVWGAIAYDGAQLVFGTGNTCAGDIATSQGAVSLNPSTGAQNWSFVADTDEADDMDTGSGVLLQNGVAALMNKDGSLYMLNANTGAQEYAAPLGAAAGYGSYASPTSDGSIYLVGAGLFPEGSATTRSPDSVCWLVRPVHEGVSRRPDQNVAGYTSKLDAVSATGQILWSLPMNDRIVGYVSVDGELAFAGVDSNVDALDIRSGGVLWSFPSAGGTDFDSSPVVVPSGVYAADESGYVYAYALPQSDANDLIAHGVRKRSP